MSMPMFPPVDSDLTREQALNMILASIAMEELALSHILNAEGEKLQYVLARAHRKECRDTKEILAVNDSVTALLEGVLQNQMLLKGKMEKVLAVLPKPCEPPCPEPDCEPCPWPCCPSPYPCPPFDRAWQNCHREGVAFESDAPCLWRQGGALAWRRPLCPTGEFTLYKGDCSRILLPCGRALFISFLLNTQEESALPVHLELRVSAARQESFSFEFYFSNERGARTLTGGTMIKTPQSEPGRLVLLLQEPQKITLSRARLSVWEI